MQKRDKFGKPFGAMILVAGAIYLAYKAPFWIDNQWKVSFCYLVALLLVLAGITLIFEQVEPKRGKEYGCDESGDSLGSKDDG